MQTSSASVGNLLFLLLIEFNRWHMIFMRQPGNASAKAKLLSTMTE
ncbi:hypothetical protein MD484_g8679, partial [Candolleomyces efflorescens]